MVTGVRGSDRTTAASQAWEGGQQRGQYKHRVGYLNVVLGIIFYCLSFIQEYNQSQGFYGRNLIKLTCFELSQSPYLVDILKNIFEPHKNQVFCFVW